MTPEQIFMDVCLMISAHIYLTIIMFIVVGEKIKRLSDKIDQLRSKPDV